MPEVNHCNYLTVLSKQRSLPRNLRIRFKCGYFVKDFSQGRACTAEQQGEVEREWEPTERDGCPNSNAEHETLIPTSSHVREIYRADCWQRKNAMRAQNLLVRNSSDSLPLQCGVFMNIDLHGVRVLYHLVHFR